MRLRFVAVDREVEPTADGYRQYIIVGRKAYLYGVRIPFRFGRLLRQFSMRRNAE